MLIYLILQDAAMSEDPKICSRCGSTMSPGLVATGAGTVRQYKCDNEKCGHTIVDVGLGG